MKWAVLLCLGIAVVSAIDVKMCMRDCRMDDHYCRWTGAPGESGHFCMQKHNECNVGCVQNCKTKCKQNYALDECIQECQYRGMMMIDMDIPFVGKYCMDECMWMAEQCDRRCHDTFSRNGMGRPRMEYIYPEMMAEDWTVKTGLMDNPNREQPPSFPSSNIIPAGYPQTRQRYY